MIAHVVVFEAWNVTRYVFVSNKRREIAGASELITHLDRRWVHDAVDEMFPGFAGSWRIENEPVEIVSAGAGSVKLLVRDQEVGRRLVTAVTCTALRNAPGLDVYGVVGAPFEWDGHDAVASAIRDTVASLDDGRKSRPGPDVRFLRLPITDECATTGLPAVVDMDQPGGGPPEPRSAESRAKSLAYGQQDAGNGLARLAELALTSPEQLARTVNALQDRQWVGLVYVDGNGLGDVFRHFDDLVEGVSARSYVDTLRAFSDGIDECARFALGEAIRELTADDGREPLVLPLILGGDDVVLLCDGPVALQLTVGYLRSFERLTRSRPEVSGPLRHGGRSSTLTASAGVAVVKGHHPFWSAARLAGELLRDAKRAKRAVERPCSALAFHVLFDTNDAQLARLLGERDTGHDQGSQPNRPVVYFDAQPYVVTDNLDDLGGWIKGRRWEDLLRRAAAIRAVGDDGERLIPATQLHRLREAVFAGRRTADARLAGVLPRYHGKGLEALCGEPGSLFWTENPGGATVTGLLDAMDAAALWEQS